MPLWLVATVVGPIALVIVLAWAMWRNKQSKIPRQVSEEGARRVYAREEQARRDGADGAP